MSKQRRRPWDGQPSQRPAGERRAEPPPSSPKPKPQRALTTGDEAPAPVQASLPPLTVPALRATSIAPDAQGLGERFMAAFNDMESAIRAASGASHDSFATLARSYFGKHGLTGHLDALSDFVDLRNTLAHGKHFTSGLLATPAPEVVAQVEALRDLVIRPPRVLELISTGVAVCAPSDQLETVLPLIAEHGYSHIPVYDERRFAGVLTNYAIARWLAQAWESGSGVHSAPVAQVLRYGSRARQAAFVDQDATAADVVGLLVGTPSTTRVPVVLVSSDGTERGTPLAIATAGDLATLIGALRLDVPLPDGDASASGDTRPVTPAPPATLPTTDHWTEGTTP